MAAGLAVATPPRNGAAELLVDGANGFVCDQDFSSAFRALENPRRLRELGNAARTTAERFGWSAHADAVLALWHRLRARA